MAERQGKCIFCGGNGLTKEHVWASWLHELIGKTESSHRLRRDRLHSQVGVQLVEDRTYHGSVTSRKRRCVCADCNSGWMSSIEGAAKAVMSPVILGQAVTLSPAEQQSICTWLTLKTILEDRSRLEESSVLDSEVATFHSRRQPLPRWRLFIGSYQGQLWNPSRLFYSYCYAQYVDRQDRYQATTWVAGRLFLHAMSGTGILHQTFGFPYALASMVHQIHPSGSSAELALPREPTITDWSAMDIADALYQSCTGHRSITNRY